MWASTVTAYLHYLGFMLSFGALAIEGLTLKPDLTLKEAWKIVIADAVYGVSATVVLITGVLRVLYFGKGASYYMNNPAFFIKIGLFIVVGTISLYPTISFILWVKELQAKMPPKLELAKVKRLSWIIRGELLGFSLIPLFAAMMARGVSSDWFAMLF
ncbi:DUF2214 family protein [Spirulina sp. CS-785/01]|uniref:DUF2214 family protein n=1 Tax=Spirulina sp. CS-785/01 TaxID=3021716 RepID=UPI00232E2F52|nr:DUF2214 family protein [Spirulina sp. CS-785/01]MDB9312695.1 DUF2214 family protein [Spirulina sp. CS-785/01]